MPTDILFFWPINAVGLLMIGVVLFLPFYFWRVLLGGSYPQIGVGPLVIAYVCALIGLAVVNFVFAYTEFNARVASGALADKQRWSIVSGWTIYTGVLSLAFVLPMLGLLGTPIAALLLRWHRLSYRNIVIIVLTLWLSLTVISWVFSGNEWQQTHRLESFVTLLGDSLPGVLLVAAPFFMSLRLATRRGVYGQLASGVD